LGDEVDDLEKGALAGVSHLPSRSEGWCDLLLSDLLDQEKEFTPSLDHISQEDNVTSTVLPNNPMRDLEKGALGGVRPPIGDAAYLASRLDAVEAERSVQSDEERVLAIQNRIREQINAHREGRRTQEQRDLEQGALAGVSHLRPALTCSDQEKEFTPYFDHISQEKTMSQARSCRTTPCVISRKVP
jgi:hypothetical protein